SKVFLFKFDGAGSVAGRYWPRVYGDDTSILTAERIVVASDGGIYVGGRSLGGGARDVYVMRLDPTGAVSWTRN
ncbi:hypothetical protein ACP3W1_29075, partial [Salmonella enterica]|uniref:hypothetical protein n=1 Tax=Salmonella enterica TaxID=28901 RepID=UPI003CF026AF